MSTDRRERVQELFEAAVACAPEQRDALLADACGDDAELRADVESLLAHDRQAPDDFLRPPEVDPELRQRGASDAPDPLTGGRIGNYRIERVIAAGGMGTVYLARQDNPEREVALKVMRAGIASRSALRRFEYESQILARLRHPNIAQVYEAGTHDDGSGGVPYFVMEYVPDAETITDYAEQQELDSRERLELLAGVCEAVHHGHQKGIIHRDLKPGNILVDSTGQAKIIDFGVARSTDADVAVTTMWTKVGELIGTLQYMSPEQCDADPHEIDTRSDVYSLGVVLYELLWGRLPYDLSDLTIQSAARVICEAPPTRPSTITGRGTGVPPVARDVETIALKALEKDREQRYASTADLAQDIRRYLNREPIEAKPPTAWTRAVHWVTRHPVLTSTSIGAVGGAAIVGGAILVGVWQFNARPHRVELSGDGREARLRSFVGGVLNAWRAEHPSEITFAELVDRSPELGGGRLVVLGFNQAQTSPFAGSLCAFDTEGDYKTPLWVRRIGTEEILPPLRQAGGHVGVQFGPNWGKLLDVFPERPGREIVVSFQHTPYSACVIRIYDLTGTLLYQVWQDGGVGPCYWMSDAELLVFVGLNGEAPWDRRGYPETREIDPRVVFAVRPRLNFIAQDWLRPAPGGDPLNPVWYRCLLPPDAVDHIDGWTVKASLPPHDPGCSVCLSLVVSKDIEAGVSWTINAAGEEVISSRVVSDEYNRNQKLPEGDPKRLPAPSYFKIGDLPPIVSTSESAAESSQ